MKVYVAGKAGREGAALARNAMYALEAAGHEITLDWTMFASQRELSPPQRRNVASQMIHAVNQADALVLARIQGRKEHGIGGHPEGEPLGAYIELGMALAWGKPVVVLPRASIFWTLDNVHQVENADEAVKKLEELK